MQMRNPPWPRHDGLDRVDSVFTPMDVNATVAHPAEPTRDRTRDMMTTDERLDWLEQMRQEQSQRHATAMTALADLKKMFAVAHPVILTSLELRETILNHLSINKFSKDDGVIATRGCIDADCMVVQSRPHFAELFRSLYGLTAAEYQSNERFRGMRASLNRRCEARIIQMKQSGSEAQSKLDGSNVVRLCDTLIDLVRRGENPLHGHVAFIEEKAAELRCE